MRSKGCKVIRSKGCKAMGCRSSSNVESMGTAQGNDGYGTREHGTIGGMNADNHFNFCRFSVIYSLVSLSFCTFVPANEVDRELSES